MDKRLCTFLIFPGAHARVRKIRLPFYALQSILGLAVVGILTLAVLAGNYARMLLEVSNYNSARSEREALKSQYRGLETNLSETSAKLESMQSLVAEVAWTYGFSNAWRSRFPRAVLVMATQQHSSPEESYNASLYAFNLLKALPLMSSSYGDSNTPSLWPVQGRITAGFGQRMDPLTGEGAFHPGIDIAAPSGTDVEAAADGILFHAGPDADYGIEVLIDHGFGITTKYGHLSKTLVLIGQEVKRGQVIGTVGTTGRSTGPHLHYEVRIYESPVNPAKYLPGTVERAEFYTLSAGTGFSQHGGR